MARSAGREHIPFAEPIAPTALAHASRIIPAASAPTAAAAVLARAEIAEPKSSSLPPPVLPVLRGHLPYMSVATIELDFASLLELAENDWV